MAICIDGHQFVNLMSLVYELVPMARGKHLYPFRTQKLSLVAVTILGVHPWENSTVPNYKRVFRIGGLFFLIEGSSLSANIEINHRL